METSVYIKKFKIAIAIVVAAFVLFILIIAKTIPSIQSYYSLKKEYTQSESKLADAERQLENLKEAKMQEQTPEVQLAKAFFRPIGSGLDSETAISEEFAEILQVMRDNKVKARSIKYDYDPQDDNFVKNAGAKYHVCRITADMVANYSNFEGFLRDLFKHEHFLEISKLEIVPYQKDKKILLINLQIKLYAQKNS